MKRRLFTLGASLLVAGTQMGNIPVHAGSTILVQSDSISNAPGLMLNSTANALQAINPACGKVIDPLQTANVKSVTFGWQEATGSNQGNSILGEFSDVESVEIDTGVLKPSESPNGMQTNGAGIVGPETNNVISGRNAHTAASASPRSGTSVDTMQVKWNLCGSIPDDNFFNTATDHACTGTAGCDFLGASFNVYFNSPEQENMELVGYGADGAPVYRGPYPAAQGFYYEASVEVTNGGFVTNFCMWDPFQISICNAGDPDSVDRAVACVNSATNLDNPCVGGNTLHADANPTSWIQINDVNGGYRNQLVYNIPYSIFDTPLSNPGSTYNLWTWLNPGDPITNIFGQVSGLFNVGYPGPCGATCPQVNQTVPPGCNPAASVLNGGCAANVSTAPLNFIVSELLPIDQVPGVQFCTREPASAATGPPNPNGCGTLGEVAFDFGLEPFGYMALVGGEAIPNPLVHQNPLDIGYTQFPCGGQAAADGGLPEAYPGQQGQAEGGEHNAASALCTKEGAPPSGTQASTTGQPPSCSVTVLRSPDTTAYAGPSSGEGPCEPHVTPIGDGFNNFAPVTGRIIYPGASQAKINYDSTGTNSTTA